MVPVSSFRLFFARSVLVGAAIVLGVACSDDPSNGERCKQSAGPAFIVTVRTEVGPLPEDLVVTAHYGGGEESFSLEDGTPGSGERIMSCKPQHAGDSLGLGGLGGDEGLGGRGPGPAPGGWPGHGGAPGAPEAVTSLVCTLWADSAVTIGMTAMDYEFEDQELTLDFDECGVITTNVDAVLLRPPPNE